MDAAGTEDWRLTSEGACAFFRTESFAQGASFIHAISELPEVDEQPPAVDVRKGGVTVRTITYTDDWFGPSTRDVELARRISVLARELGLTADPSAVQSVLIIPGATDITKVMPFWQALLDYERRKDSPEEDLVDPHDRGPAFWFERMEQPRADGGAIHVAVWVPPEKAAERVAAALAAGGKMVRDEYAPAWWTLADAFGNEADIATAQSRD